MKKLDKFPQISLKFPALPFSRFSLLLTRVGFLLLCLALILNLNSSLKNNNDLLERLRNSLFVEGDTLETHLKLGDYYLSLNDLPKSQREYLLAQNLFSSSPSRQEGKVLGSMSSPWETWENQIAAKTYLQKEINRWKKIILIHPDYKPAYLELAVLQYNLNNIQTARQYLDKYNQSEPDNQYVEDLKRLF